MKRLIGAFDATLPGRDSLDPLIRNALDEDHAFGDRSALPLPACMDRVTARVLAREPGVLAGVPIFRRVFELLAGPGVATFGGRPEGSAFQANETVLSVEGPAGVLLAGERTALNFLQHLSGVATITRRAVDASGGKFAVCDTRKTTPGLRALEKYAVVVGGGRSHRWHLADMVMLKENHLALAGGVTEAVEAIRRDDDSKRLPITVEARTQAEAMEAAALGVDRILLDNMSPDEMRAVVDALPKDARPEIEASGGLTADTVGRLRDCGIDLVSLGSLTHSVRAIDFSFLLESVS
jgi:nicotinate-nucleotide pyrophosphorylase (carboxylating)